MGQAVPMDDLPGSLVPEDDLPAELTAATSQEGPVAPESTAGALGAVAPAITGAAYAAETGLPQLARDVGQAVGKPAMQAVGGYLKNPINVLTDVALAHMGAPPVAAAKKVYDAYQGAKQVVSGLGEAFSKVPEETLNKLKPAINLIESKIPNIPTSPAEFKNYRLPPELAGDAKLAAALKEVQSAVPGTLDKVGRVVGPLARGAGRVLGPAGMALNVYDAAKFAQEAELGKRLARGEGKLAPQVFRGLVNQNISGYTPTPQEAQNLLDSGDERTINIYGGRLKLQGLASPGPNAVKSGFDQELTNLARKRQIGR